MTPKARLHSSMIRMIEELGPVVFLTLNLPPIKNPYDTGRLVEEVLKRTEYKAHGKRWARYPPHLRLRALAFLEHPTTNPHWHTLIAGPPEIIAAVLEHSAAIWGGLIRNGHGDVELVRNLKASSRYVTKEMWQDWSFDSYVAYGPTRPR